MSFSCRKCNYKEIVHNLDLSLAARLIEHRLCHNCYQWSSLASSKEKLKHSLVVINSICYLINNTKSSSKFTIRFRDGKQITTHNLFLFGEVPKRWRKLLTDNARFVKRK